MIWLIRSLKKDKELLFIFVILLSLGFAITAGGHKSVLEIKRDFSTEPFNSQTVLGLNKINYLKQTNLFGLGGSSNLEYNNGVVIGTKVPLTEPKETEVKKEELNKKLKYYTVLKGDTVSGIARKFEISQNTLIWENNIKNNKLKIGQELTILPVNGFRYEIKKGDTLSSIAKKYGISIDEIKKYNEVSDKGLKIGEKIILPGAKKEKVLAKKTKKKKNSSFKEVKNASSGVMGLAGDGNVQKYVKRRGIVPYNKGAFINVPKRVPGRYKYTKTDYGYFTHPAPGSTRTQGIHGWNAIDMAAPIGSNIYAAADGVVIKASSGGWGGGYGTYVMIKHPNGLVTMYAHNSKLLVQKGEKVKKGQVIAKMGSTGRSTGSHVHFEVRGGYNPF